MRALLLLVVAACGVTASPDPGLDALMQIRNADPFGPAAQYVPGPFPDDGDGPLAVTLLPHDDLVTIGSFDQKVHGAAEGTAHVVAFGVGGIPGAWLVTTKRGEIEEANAAASDVVLGLSYDFPPGAFRLLMAAADAQGHFGAHTEHVIVAAAEEPPAGELVVALTWDGPADLDLHVVDALGGEAWSDKPNTFTPVAGEPVDPAEPPKHGILDHDANANCHRDGHPAEHIVWKVPPPSGNYVVRVDARNMCGAPSQAWEVSAYTCAGNDPNACVVVGAARGFAVPDDVSLEQHGLGAGVLALKFAL